MTCIVGLVHEGTVYVGGDSQGTYGGTVVVPMDRGKVSRRGEFLLGSCGSGRVAALLRHAFEPPKLAAGKDLDAYMAGDFASAMYELLSAHHALAKESETSRDCMGEGGAVLVGARGRLFLLDSYFCPSPVADTYFAIGSGGDVALGVLYALAEDDRYKPHTKVERAIQAAIKHVDGCGGPVTVLELPPERG